MKAGLAQMAKGGIIMDVTNAQEARIAEEAGVSIIEADIFSRIICGVHLAHQSNNCLFKSL